MQINKIILENFGLYRGEKVFDLQPNRKGSKKPIILFGGRNGAGKTTFLNSIRLALYGKRSLGERTTKEEYNDYLLQKIHRHPEAIHQARTARVALEFDFVTQGEKNTFFIQRFWENVHGKAIETVSIHKNGNILDDVDSEFWNTFISDIIPERLSQLFFFDGEKIQDIADDIKGNAAIAEAIQTLLGLDVVEKLKADLKIYVSREAKNVSDAQDKKALNQLEEIISSSKGQAKISLNEKAELRSKVDGIKRSIERIEETLRSQGAEFSASRDQNKHRETQVVTRIEEHESNIYQECSELFPLALCPNISSKLLNQLDLENEAKKQKILNNELSSIQREIANIINASSSFVDKQGRDDLFQKIENQLNLRSQVDDDIVDFHQLSDSEVANYKYLLEVASIQSAKKVHQYTSEMETLNLELQKVRKSINQAPDDVLLQDKYKELSQYQRDLGEATAELNHLEEKIRLNEVQMDKWIRDKQKIEEKQREHKGHHDRAEKVDRITAALTDYNQRLTDMKLTHLRDEVVKAFNHIARKSQFVQDVLIDRHSFEVTLIDSKGKTIPKEDLSSGEKQIFAIAFLWALAKTSGRPLPVIIDTPLGRLDSEHRLNLVENYFSNASHQVVLFSTDTEVDENLYRILEPHISHCYHLRFDKQNFETVAEEEYFWKELNHV